VDEAFEKVMTMGYDAISDELADMAVYHYYPSVEQVRKWLDQENFFVEADGLGKWYRHFVVRKI